MKIYKIKLNDKVYEVQLEEMTESNDNIHTPKKVLESAQTDHVSLPGGEDVTAPMPGSIFDIKVKVGDSVAAGQVVAILEAMKMETEILAPNAGTVSQIHVTKGSAVNLGDAIVSLTQ